MLICAPFTRNSDAMMKDHKIKTSTEQALLNVAQPNGGYPQTRLRRLRSAPWIRDIVSENALRPEDFTWPVFITEGQNNIESIASMPDVHRYSTDKLIEELKPALDLGLRAIALFPVVPEEKKTMDGHEAYNPDNLICRAISEIKNTYPDLGIITDVALDPYTTHGHDGLLQDGIVLNDETVEILAQQALVQAQAGADVIAPSDMMDGRIGVIRNTLDSKGLENVLLLSYAAKYASGFYGPFRDAVNSGHRLTGDKKTYQMDPSNSDEALREVQLDIEEGADAVMIKPGLPYLDIIRRVKDNFSIPVFAYQVSGEYAMIKAASQNGWLDYESTMIESLMSFKRAGACNIFTYCTPDALKLLDKASKKTSRS